MAIMLLAALAPATPASANNYGESLAWQFRTSADRVNVAVILDMIEKRKSGYYRPPTYNTTVERQYNCGITSTATGNSDTQTAIANSPTVTGATASANGNVNHTSLAGRSATNSSTGQANSGAVSSGVIGSTSATTGGIADQALISTQSNSGNQSASVAASTACLFGALN